VVELRSFDMVPEAMKGYLCVISAHPSPSDITMGELFSIACCMTVAGQKQRPTISFLLNVSTSTTRKSMPSPAVMRVCCVSLPVLYNAAN
jgi:hypothetical protein